MPNPLVHVSNGLLDPKHVKAIGPAIWEFLVLLDKQTAPDGTVNHGRAMTATEIAARLGTSERSVRRNLTRLRRYVQIERWNHGFRFRVRNPKKLFRSDTSVRSTGSRSDRSAGPDRTDLVSLSSISYPSKTSNKPSQEERTLQELARRRGVSL